MSSRSILDYFIKFPLEMCHWVQNSIFFTTNIPILFQINFNLYDFHKFSQISFEKHRKLCGSHIEKFSMKTLFKMRANLHVQQNCIAQLFNFFRHMHYISVEMILHLTYNMESLVEHANPLACHDAHDVQLLPLLLHCEHVLRWSQDVRRSVQSHDGLALQPTEMH